MKQAKTWLGFIVLGLVVYGLWLVLSFFVNVLSNADPKISASILGAMATIFVGLTAVIITQNQTKIRDREEAHRASKIKMYKEYLDTIKAIMVGSNDNVSLEAPTNQELVDYLVNFKTELLLCGSPEVIKRQLEFQVISNNGGDIFIAVDNLYKAIRADIGLSNKKLNSLELVKMYLADPTELDSKEQVINQ